MTAGRTGESLCWSCRRALGGCSWSGSFRPVEGWEAVRRDMPVRCRQGWTRLESYHVSGCPQYWPDPPRRCRPAGEP